jgi:outer membrane protein assembly factor BamB
MKPRSTWVVCALCGVFVVVSAASAQERAAAVRKGPLNLGDSQADLLYTPITPCRIIDTRLAGGPIAGGTTRDFRVTGTDLSTQGGSATGCGIPAGAATAAVINFVAVNPAGPGDLRITPFGTPMPTASILNYAAVPGLNIANGPTVAICDPAVAACASDFTIQADSAATQVVADVQGYFRNLRAEQLPAPINPNQVAILRSYSANQTADFPIGTNPAFVAFDGANIWVTANFPLLTKLRASDGASLGTFAVSPGGMAFDGANLWVASVNNNNVTKLRASDGTSLGTFPVGTSPQGVAFDGANIWVANYTSNNVTKLRASDGSNLGTFPVGTRPIAAAFDGANIWVTNYLSDNVTKLRASDGTSLGTFPIGSRPYGVAFDGANVWVANSGNVTKLRASDGTNLGNFPVGKIPLGVAFDGANIWVANSDSNSMTKLRASDGTNLGTFATGNNPVFLAFDGANIWVTNQGSGTVSKR